MLEGKKSVSWRIMLVDGKAFIKEGTNEEDVRFKLETKNAKPLGIEVSLTNDFLEEEITSPEELPKGVYRHFDNFREYYSKEFSLYESSPDFYYELFKDAVLEGNYLEAFFQLQLYDRKLGKNSNLQLLYKMLMMLTGQKEEIEESNPNYIGDVRVDYEPLLANYRLAESSFDKENYQKTLKHLSICENLAKRKSIEIDFSTMILLANSIFLLCKEDQKKRMQQIFANSNDVGERMMIAHKLLELDDSDFENNFLYMDAYIDLKAYTPLLGCISKLEKLPATEEEQVFLSLYKRLTSEIMTESNHLKKIHESLKRGEILQQEALYETAISCYKEVSHSIPFPYFQIKEAEAYYAMGDLENAIRCCENYLNSGYLHYVEASILLYQIYSDKGEIGKAFQVILECYANARMKARGITLQDWLTRLNISKCGDTSSLENELSKQYLLQDLQGNKK